MGAVLRHHDRMETLSVICFSSSMHGVGLCGSDNAASFMGLYSYPFTLNVGSGIRFLIHCELYHLRRMISEIRFSSLQQERVLILSALCSRPYSWMWARRKRLSNKSSISLEV